MFLFFIFSFHCEVLSRNVKSEEMDVIDVESESDIFGSNSDSDIESQNEISILEYVRKEPVVKIPGLNLVFGEEDNVCKDNPVLRVARTDCKSEFREKSEIVKDWSTHEDASYKSSGKYISNETGGPKIVAVQSLCNPDVILMNQSDNSPHQERYKDCDHNKFIKNDYGSLSKCLKTEQNTTDLSNTYNAFGDQFPITSNLNALNSLTLCDAVRDFISLAQETISKESEFHETASYQTSDDNLVKTSMLRNIKKEEENISQFQSLGNSRKTLSKFIPFSDARPKTKVCEDEDIRKHSQVIRTDINSKLLSNQTLDQFQTKSNPSLESVTRSHSFYGASSSLKDCTLSSVECSYLL